MLHSSVSKKPESGPLVEFVDWLPVKGGDLHPAVCPLCGNLADRNFVEPGFQIEKRSDVSVTFDGWVIVSEEAREFFGRLVSGAQFDELEAEPGYTALNVESLSVARIDEAGSGIRRAYPCDNCGFDGEVLLGIVPVRPPKPKELKLLDVDSKAQLAIGDIYFGSGFLKTPRLFASEAFALAVEQAGLTGIVRTGW